MHDMFMHNEILDTYLVKDDQPIIPKALHLSYIIFHLLATVTLG